MSQVSCHSEQRRRLVRERQGWNGLDYLEVSDNQLGLRVYFLGKAPENITAANVLISGGRRVTDIQVTAIAVERDPAPEVDDYMQVFVDKFGDFSNYQLILADTDPETGRPIYDGEGNHRKLRPLTGFDPRYNSLEFNFKVGCPSDLDCAPSPGCEPESGLTPDINYLAKDYGSFRQLILDRLALTMPDWQERHVPDLGITLVELLAYVGDHLSYYQDAVATEAYLDTARRRVSVRRHARLVDYRLHEGCNARALVALEVDGDYLNLKASDFYLITASDSYQTALKEEQVKDLAKVNSLIFEPLVADPNHEIPLYQAHNAIRIYTWGDSQCCLPKGSTRATLLDPGTASPAEPEPEDSCRTDTEAPQTNASPKPRDSDYQLHLDTCDLLIFEEVKGPATGHPGDADPRHRQAVRLTHVERGQDPLTGQLLWEVEWAQEDALEFPLCISAIHREDCSPIEDVSLARGNLVLVDHGRSVSEQLPPVPGEFQPADCIDHCRPAIVRAIPTRHRVGLKYSDLTFSQPLPPCRWRHCCHEHVTPARQLLTQDPRAALPAILLTETEGPEWTPRLDLLSCDSDDRHFVVEVEEDRRAQLRFGDGDCGRMPVPGTEFVARYRLGNGNRGNLGADSISHIVFRNALPDGLNFVRVRNPLPARGGIDPEPLAEARLYAPQAFKKVLKRAITPKDYSDIVQRDFAGRIQGAAARLHWTGSWYEILVALDPLDGETDPDLLEEVACHLTRYRRIGHDLVVDWAQYVPVDLAIGVCVKPGFVRGRVKAALLDAFSDRRLIGGTTGFFHADNLGFGEGIQLSEVVARAQAVTGVAAVQVLRLQRQFEPPNGELENGILPIGPFEIAVLRQDPNFPEQGKLTLELRGGR